MNTKIYELRFDFPKAGNYELFFSYPPSEYSVRNAAASRLNDHPTLRDAIIDAASKVNVETLADGDSRQVHYCGTHVGNISLHTHHCWQ